MSNPKDIATEISETAAAKFEPKPTLMAQIANVLPGMGMSAHEAFVMLLEAAVVIDGVRDPDEVQEREALAGRSKELGRLQSRKVVEIQKAVRERFAKAEDQKAKWELVMEACLQIPGGWRESVFAHIVDLVFADRVLAAAESQMLKVVANQFKIPPERALEIVRYLRIKNEHVPGFAAAEPRSIAPTSRTATDFEFDEMGILSPEEAHFAILMCAAWADGAKLPPEGAELDALWRTKSLAACSDALRLEVTRKVKALAKKVGWEQMLDVGCAHLPDHLKLPVYGQAADLTLADQHLHHKEAKMLSRLEMKLGIDRADAHGMLRIIKLKNDH